MKIYITGEITDKPYDGCYSPEDLKTALEGIDENEPLEVEITSEGGSVFAGIQIANMLARWKGNVTTHAVGFVASIATVILMAAKRIVVDSNCFCLIHLPWTIVQGNTNDLEKEIDTLEKCEQAMMSFYMRHAKVSEKEIKKCLEDETWLLGSEFADMFDVEILECDQPLDIAAKFDLSKYKNIPKRILDMTKEEEKIEVVDADAKPMDEASEPSTTEEIVSANSDTIEESKTIVEESAEVNNITMEHVEEIDIPDAEDTDEFITKAECEKRVSGMQSSMQKQINDFRNQLKAKDEELINAKAEITRLTNSFNEVSKELLAMKGELEKAASALEEKQNALAKLNAGVNTPTKESIEYSNNGFLRIMSSNGDIRKITL